MPRLPLHWRLSGGQSDTCHAQTFVGFFHWVPKLHWSKRNCLKLTSLDICRNSGMWKILDVSGFSNNTGTPWEMQNLKNLRNNLSILLALSSTMVSAGDNPVRPQGCDLLLNGGWRAMEKVVHGNATATPAISNDRAQPRMWAQGPCCDISQWGPILLSIGSAARPFARQARATPCVPPKMSRYTCRALVRLQAKLCFSSRARAATSWLELGTRTSAVTEPPTAAPSTVGSATSG